MKVSVAVALPARQAVVEVDVPEGATVAQAIEAAGVKALFPAVDWAAVRYGVWSRPCAPERSLEAGDRVEVYRQLAADPREQRRARLRTSSRPRNAP